MLERGSKDLLNKYFEEGMLRAFNGYKDWVSNQQDSKLHQQEKMRWSWMKMSLLLLQAAFAAVSMRSFTLDPPSLYTDA